MAEEEKNWPWTWKVPEGGVIGKRGIRRMDGYEKASGTAVYTRDVSRPNMLYAKFLQSPYAHARIVSMDTSKAEAYPGVKTVVKWDDPELVWANSLGAFGNQSEHVTDTAHYAGQPIGAIVCAESEAIVDEALKLVEIVWEELPFEVDWEKALEPGAPILRPDKNPDNNIGTGFMFGAPEHGDIEAGFAEADHIVNFTIKKEEDVWAGVEPHSGVAEWKGDHLNVWARIQSIDTAHCTLSGWTKRGNVQQIPYAQQSNIHIHAKYLGGQFGGLEWIGYSATFPNLPTLLAKRTGRPVKMLFDGSHFYGASWETGTYKFKIGFKNNGKVTAVDIETIWCHGTILKLWEGFSIENIRINAIFPYLSRGATICYKDGGSACLLVQEVMNRVAAELGMDPTEVAEINDGCSGHSMEHINETVKVEQGFDPTRDSLKEVHAIGKAAIDWDNIYHAPGTKILPNGNYHGVGYMSVIGWMHSPGQTTTGLKVKWDGSVSLLAQHADGGWNSETTFTQVVADEAGLKFEDIGYEAGYDVGFYARAGGNSGGMVGTLPSMVGAARKLKKLVLEHAVAPRPGAWGGPPSPAFFDGFTVDDLDMKDSVIFEKANPENNLPLGTLARVFESTQWGGSNLYTWHYAPSITPPVTMEVMVRQCYFMEVEVDPDTGQCHVKRVVVVNDPGRVMSPDTCNGQQYGGVYMAISRSNTEAVYFDPQTGIKLNDNLIFYPIALMNDCSGEIDCHLVETGLSYGPYGTCGIGESGTAAAQWLTGPAIYNAIGKWVDYPTTPDKVLKALGKI